MVSFKEKTIWEGKEYEMEWVDDTNFSKLKNITQIYGFLFDKNNNFVIVRPTKARGWRLPGGKIEYGEDWKQALIRESVEEADVEVYENSLIPFGYIKVTPLDKGENVHYMLRAFGKIRKINDQTEDPAEGLVNEREFISYDEFLNYCPWGKIGKVQLDRAVKLLSLSKLP